MDALDRKVLEVLMRNGRTTWAELAQELELSGPAGRKKNKNHYCHGFV
ncbi:AsnC family protein [Ectobacillus panaciterrae]|nr:AsnC family protein [Ectobacillus panaciterrae]